MDVSKNRGFNPEIIHLFIGFSMIFTIHFGVPGQLVVLVCSIFFMISKETDFE